jgi:hypothetical protein
MEHDWADGVQEDKVDTTCCTWETIIVFNI